MSQSILIIDNISAAFYSKHTYLVFYVKCCHLTSATWDLIICSEIREFIPMAASCVVTPVPKEKQPQTSLVYFPMP